MKVAHVILVAVVLQRVGELWYSSRNTRALKSRGATEYGQRHYPLLVALHASWLAAVAIGVRLDPSVRPVPLALFLLVQGVRVWILATLGPYWTTRVITVPDAPLVRRGPYRFLSHPNYLVVIAEMALLPLVFGQVGTALVFSVLNGAVLAWRIHIENAALEPRRGLSGRG
jgi:methyltransferase